MHQEMFSHLYNAFKYDNFEILVATLDKNFRSLFNFPVLEQEYAENRKNGSYTLFFNSMFSKLSGLYTEEEIISEMYKLLGSDAEVQNCYYEKLVFVPHLNGKPSPQLSFHEKLGTGELKPAEPLTYFDMLRVTRYLLRIASRRSRAYIDIAVFSLDSLQKIKDPAVIKQLIKNKKVLVINLTRDPKGTAKWAVVDLNKKSAPRLYCESLLLEAEKKCLDEVLNMNISEYLGGTCNHSVSSGYTAVAWLDQNIIKAWNFDLSSDFNNLFSEYVCAQFSGDAAGLVFKCVNDEYTKYITPELRFLLKIYNSAISALDGEVLTGHLSITLAVISGIGKVNGQTVRLNDMAGLVKVLGQQSVSYETFRELRTQAYRSQVPEFSSTMQYLENTLRDDQQSSTLEVSPYLDVEFVRRNHEVVCMHKEINYGFFKYLMRANSSDCQLSSDIKKEDVAAAMVLTLFRTRCKKRKLTINLPDNYNLNAEEQAFIINVMQDNPYLTELDVMGCQDLFNIKNRLKPVLARNRWLFENHYLPPVVDDYWRRAAFYWLVSLNERHDLLSGKAEHENFLGCMREMGDQGLKSVLELLTDETQRELIDGIYGKNRPLFILANESSQPVEYFTPLIKHLDRHAHFPFSELSVAWQPGFDSVYADFFAKLNSLDKFDQIHLTLPQDPKELESFLTQILQTANEERWTSLIAIPDVELRKAGGNGERLRCLVSGLNNLIVRNRHLKANADLLADIKNNSDFNEDFVPENMPQGSKNIISLVPVAEPLAQFKSTHKGPWPLKRTGEVQLQLQQQQEIQQSRQFKMEQVKARRLELEEIIPAERVTWKNIDSLLSSFYKEFASENNIETEKATLRTEGETILQGFFHTWINANPKVQAPYIISAMTVDAAKMLLRKHASLLSGLNPDNLPKGFYTQRGKDAELILCYNPELAVGSTQNALTPDLNVLPIAGRFWEGDFRLFKAMEFAINPQSATINDEDWPWLKLFGKLQPKKDHTLEFEAFCEKYPDVKNRVMGNNGIFSNLFSSPRSSDVRKITKNWFVFYQLWQHQGMAGVEIFLKTPEKKFKLSVKQAFEFLFQKQSEATRKWVKSMRFSGQDLKAFGQVYYLFGEEGLTLFLAKLKQMDKCFGHDFFVNFYHNVLASCQYFDTYISERWFAAMDDMMSRLHGDKNQHDLQAWMALAFKHKAAIPHESVVSLWRGFEYFIKELADQGLVLNGDEFNKLGNQNMLVCMDRILHTLRALPRQNDKVRFLKELATVDLTQGGIHYAVQCERFRYFEQDLELHDFYKGEPTYAPDLKNLYTWNANQSELNIKRVLASSTRFDFEDYRHLSNHLSADSIQDKHILVLLMVLRNTGNIGKTLDELRELDGDFIEVIASHLHTAVYYQRQSLQIHYGSLAVLEKKFVEEKLSGHCQRLMNRYKLGFFLELVSLWWQGGQREDFITLLNLLENLATHFAHFSDVQILNAIKVYLMFGLTDAEALKPFLLTVIQAKPVVKNELRLLFNQILSLDFEVTDTNLLKSDQNWHRLLLCVNEMNAAPTQTAECRVQLIEAYHSNGLQFKYSKNGDFRSLKDNGEDKPSELGFFTDHETRLWNFMLAHIAVPSEGDAKEALQPLLKFFKKLQLNRTYLNEVEPLLSILETTPAGQFWTCSYFHQLLKSLEPEDDKISYPIPMLSVVCQAEIAAAKAIDCAEKDFPSRLAECMQDILKNTVYSREQQALLCKLALNEFSWSETIKHVDDMMVFWAMDYRRLSCTDALSMFSSAASIVELESYLEKSRWLFEQNSMSRVVSINWTKTMALWMKSLTKSHDLYNHLRDSLNEEAGKTGLILHIMAWAALRQSQCDGKKEFNLILSLKNLSVDELNILADCYPDEPSPGVDDLRRLLKQSQKEKRELSLCLDEFLCHPHNEPRRDYAKVPVSRESDLERMFAETHITQGKDKSEIPADKAVRLALIFAELKNLQAGLSYVHSTKQPVHRLSRQQLIAAFQYLSHAAAKNPEDLVIQAQLWAVLFEVLGRTSRKYPHMAQQFALIANEICIDTPSRVLQLATGEGKSHFVALRAAKHAGCGKTVDICTAKRTLAERDHEDYESFFNYLGLTSVYVHPRSSADDYNSAQIHYSTLGDLSLFLDEQSFKGQPIEVDKSKRVALFDEFDFIRFDEGCKTEYNYARPTGRTPKQMIWFYQAVNAFHEKNMLNQPNITVDNVDALSACLQAEAAEDEDKQALVNHLMKDPLQLVSWLQSAADAYDLKWGENFTVRLESIVVGDTTYPMKEIIPLSRDNQKMFGSTFSAGVHELLAVRLNTEAKKAGQSQNYHVHAESNILSSQTAAERMHQLWQTWEGFSGTISASQAKTLHDRDGGTEVLHVSTNQKTRRAWHKPAFYQTAEERLGALSVQVSDCLKNQESILFSCKNDLQVLELQGMLKKTLTEEEFSRLIFYTNDHEATAVEILQHKQKIEGWEGDKKQQAAGLVASGFGRGDNVDVEAVFLLNVNDVNDLLQKGGRTARNGEAGSVYQFYLSSELEEELNGMHQLLKNMKGVDLNKINETLSKVEADSKDEKIFAQVMLLREFVFDMHNAANEGYHAVLSGYSSWCMSLLGQCKDPLIISALSQQISSTMKNVEKNWLDISSENYMLEEKVRKIEQVVSLSGKDLFSYYSQSYPGYFSVEPFKWDPLVIAEPELILEKKLITSETAKHLASICTSLATLAGGKNHREIPDLISELSKNSEACRLFRKHLKDCDTYEQLVVQLKNALRPSSLSEFKEKAQKDEMFDTALQAVNGKLKHQLISSLERLNPDLVPGILEYLKKPGLFSVEDKVERSLNLVTYLLKFSEDQQSSWGMEYISQISDLLEDESEEKLSIWLSGDPMSIEQGNKLLKLVMTYTTSESFKDTWAALQKLSGSDLASRLRIFNDWEILVIGLDKKQSSDFLKHVSVVMSACVAHSEWDMCVKLINKTKTWWNKDGKQGIYKNDLLELWSQLALHADELGHLAPVLNKTLLSENKSWFKSLLVLTGLSKKQLQMHQSIFNDVLKYLNESGNRHERSRMFNRIIQGLAVCQRSISASQAFALSNLSPNLGWFKEALNFTMTCPENLRMSRKSQERSERNVMKALNTMHSLEAMSLKDLQRILESLNKLFKILPAKTVKEFNTQKRGILLGLENFNRIFIASEDKSIRLAEGAQNYLSFIAENPVSAAALNQLLENENLNLCPVKLSKILQDVKGLSGADWRGLFDAARNGNLNQVQFAELCEQCVQFNRLLDKIPALNDGKRAFINAELRSLPPFHYKAILSVATRDQAAVEANPELLECMLQFSKEEDLSPGRLGLLCGLMTHLAGTKTCTLEKLFHFQQGVSNFIPESAGVLRRLTALLEKAPEEAEQLLFDHVVHYLQHQIKKGDRPEVKGLFDFFYARAKEFHGDSEQIFDLKVERWARMFDFKQAPEAFRNQRIIWMHALNHGALVTGSKRDDMHDNHAYQWDIERNYHVLQKGFELYMVRTAEILNSRPNSGLWHRHDLTPHQQFELLQLSDELSIIGRPHLDLPMPSDTLQNVQVLEQELGKLMRNYESGWFKSSARKNQLYHLQAQINFLLGDVPDNGTASRYERVWLALQAAKNEAMERDQEGNHARYFKLNRSGQSRFLNTLNHMQDRVLRHWTQDAQAVQSFQVFKEHSKKSLLDLTERLFDAMTAENYPLLHAKNENLAIVDEFFTRKSVRARRIDLQAELLTFNTLHEDALNLNKDALETLLGHLERETSKLPGHLSVLAREILTTGRPMLDYLEKERQHSARSTCLD